MKSSYDTFQKDQAARKVLGFQLNSTQIFGVTYASGILMFLTTLLLMSLAFYRFAYIVVPLVLTGILCAAYAWNANRTLLYRPLAVASFAALVLGSALGLFIYDAFGYYAFIYSNTRTYRNVVVSQPAASVADAGHVIFAPEAYVDQTKAVGYAGADGTRYCVAPLRDLVNTTRVEFWAVGKGCCEWQGGFKCDAAADADARGGIVVFQGPGYFMPSTREYYTRAREKAEAMFDLQSCDKPLYVRWVQNNELDKLKEENVWRTGMMIFVGTVFYALVSFWNTKEFCKQNHDQFLGLV
jgi:hypothetical protein